MLRRYGKANMRIGVDACCWSNRRGFGRYTRELLKALISQDNINEYLFFVDKDMAIDIDFPQNVNTVFVPTHISPTKAASSSGRRSLRDIWAMSWEVMKHNIDIFFFPAVYSYFPIFNRTRIIVTVHDTIADLLPTLVFPNRKLNMFWKMKQYLAIRQAQVILTVSEYSKHQIIKNLNISKSRVRLISEAPSKVFRPLTHNRKMTEALGRYQLNPEQRFLLYVGGVSPHKNLENLIEAYYTLIHCSGYSDIKLIIIGDYENDSFYSCYPVLKQRIEQLNLEKMVAFTGFIPDRELVYFYNAASLLVLPSLLEGFGLPAIEAMACNTPVAASNTGSLPEIIGEAGCFFNPHSPSDMFNVIQNILSNDTLSAKMRERGLDRAKKFSWQKASREMLSLFNDLIET